VPETSPKRRTDLALQVDGIAQVPAVDTDDVVAGRVVVGRAGRFHADDARDLGARRRQDDPAVGRHPQRHRLLAAADADPMDRRAQLACLDGHREGRGGRRWDDLLVRRELLLVEQPGPNRPCGCLDTKYPIAGGDLELAAPRQEAQQQLDRLRRNQRPLPAQSRHRCHVQPVTIGGDHLIALQEDAAQWSLVMSSPHMAGDTQASAAPKGPASTSRW
jgi:hypothetical protein